MAKAGPNQGGDGFGWKSGIRKKEGCSVRGIKGKRGGFSGNDIDLLEGSS